MFLSNVRAAMSSRRPRPRRSVSCVGDGRTVEPAAPAIAHPSYSRASFLHAPR